ncbi:MAG: hypothetical protein K0S37_2492 [Microbacterium sp.]|nr:hypothetical protein [Microbacterium sp.]
MGQVSSDAEESMGHLTRTDTPARGHLDRRALVTGIAWAVPAVAIAVAAPVAAASTTDIGAYRLAGSCGAPSILGPGFTLTAGPGAPVPVGTTLLVSGTGVSSIGVFSITGGTATQNRLSATTTQFTLTSELPAGATMAFRTNLAANQRWTLTGNVTLPTGYTGTGSKNSATVASDFAGCTTS